jgi:hypothetical protein
MYVVSVSQGRQSEGPQLVFDQTFQYHPYPHRQPRHQLQAGKIGASIGNGHGGVFCQMADQIRT